MIHEITSTLSTFKTLRFGSGLNLLLAKKSNGASDRQTRNGAGKSSLVELVHFLLAGSCRPTNIFRSAALSTYEFEMKLDLGGQVVRASRSGANAKVVYVDAPDFSTWPIQPSVDARTGELMLAESEWGAVLGSEMFGLDPNLPVHSPTFRSVFPYFARRASDGGFLTHESFFKAQRIGSTQTALSFLFGMDWNVSRALDDSRQSEQAIKKLKKEAGTGLLESLIGKSGELQSKLAIAEKRLKSLKDEVAQFQILPEYRELEKEASSLARELSKLANENTVDLERVKSLQTSMAAELPPHSKDVVKLYEEAGVVLPYAVKRQLTEVQYFHHVILKNRKSHLQEEITEAERRIEHRTTRMQDAENRRSEVMRTLSAHGALDQFTQLQSEASRHEAETQELRRRFQIAKELEKKQGEVKVERAKIYQRLLRDHEEHQEIINEAIVLFEEFSESLSERQGILRIEPTENGTKFAIDVPSGRSQGIKSMQVFCFDLTLATLWARKGMGPGFLIHDSHLFDGVDERQVAHAIEIGAKRAREEGFQYIVTLNSDMLPMAEFSKDFNVDEYVMDVELNDTTVTGGLFGFRFE